MKQIKTILRLSVILFCSFPAYGQVSDRASLPTDTSLLPDTGQISLPENIPAQELNGAHMPRFLSPNAASLQKFGDYPVSHNNGLVEISVPLYDLELNKDVTLHVRLDYHASGIKVDEIESWAGAGWALTAGGVINREQRGFRDEAGSGFYSYSIKNKGHVFPNAPLMPHSSNDDYNFLNKAINAGFDTEPDLFTFNFNGRSGKFFVDNTGEFRMLPHSNIKIIKHPLGDRTASGSWELVDESGTKYVFGKPVTTGQIHIDMIEHQGWQTPVSWYLSAIYSSTGKLLAGFTYDSMPISYSSMTYTTSLKFKSSTCSLLDPVPETEYTGGGTVDITGANNLTAIEIPRQGKITFSGGSNRQDGVSTNAKLLGTIVLSDVNNRKVSGYSFAYSFNNKHFLDRINYSGNDNSSTIYRAFEYYDKSLFPARTSNSVDIWGYYNGISNRTKFPYFPGYNLSSFYTAADRKPTQSAVTGTLKKVTYPTKGYSVFSFENNTAKIRTGVDCFVNANNSREQLLGGLRISKIENHDADGRRLTEEKYSYVDSAGNISGIDAPLPYFKVERIYPKCISNTTIGAGSCFYTYEGISELPTRSISYPPVQYKNVIVDKMENSVPMLRTEYGYKVKEYTDFLLGVSHPVLGFLDAYRQSEDGYRYGLLTYKKEYEKQGNSFVSTPVFEEHYEYAPSAIKNLTAYYIRKRYVDFFTQCKSLDEMRVDFKYSAYNLICGAPYLKKTTTIATKAGKSITTVLSYTYANPLYLQPSAVTQTGSKGETVKQEIKYAYNKSDAVCLKMKELNMINRPVEVTKIVNTTVTETSRYNYGLFNSGKNIEIASVEKKYGGTAFTTENTIVRYNDSGDIIEYKTKDDITTIIIWGYKNRYPIAEIKNAAYSRITGIINATSLNNIAAKSEPSASDWDTLKALQTNTSLNDVHVTLYKYKPLVGITEMIDPRGFTTHYEYDTFNRLKRVYDGEGTIEAYDYNYRNN